MGWVDFEFGCQWPCLLGKKSSTHTSRKKKSRMHEALNEVYLQNLFRDGVTFRDESNDGN